MSTTGDVRLVTALGALRPSQGTQALLLTTNPDAGVAPETATVSALSIAHVTIPAGTTHLRLDGNFLTNELAPSFLNDPVTVRLHTAVDTTRLHTVDTYAPLVAVPVPGYARQTGFFALVADVTAYAGTGEKLRTRTVRCGMLPRRLLARCLVCPVVWRGIKQRTPSVRPQELR